MAQRKSCNISYTFFVIYYVNNHELYFSGNKLIRINLPYMDTLDKKASFLFYGLINVENI